MADKSNPKELLKLRNRQSGYKEKLTLSALKEKSDKFKEPKWITKKSDPKLQTLPKKWITKKEKPKSWITKKSEPKGIPKKEKPKSWITKKPLSIRQAVKDVVAEGGSPKLITDEARMGRIDKKLGIIPAEKYNKGGRTGKQFGGGLPIQPTAGANLQPTVGANPMGVADPNRRFGMKHGSKSKGGRTGLKHGGSTGAVMSGKKVGAEIK
jgi:hypothetical protein